MNLTYIKEKEAREGMQEVPEVFVRFSLLHRLEHFLVMILFTSLVVTGLPQKFFSASWSVWIIQAIGGIDRTRWIHRVIGILFALLAVWHIGRVTYQVLFRKMKPSILPKLKDFRDAILTLRYYLGLSEEQARFDRYDFRQKFEYLGLVLGGFVMIATGVILMYPVFFTQFVPGVVIPAAKTAHSYESFLAFLVIIIWHMYGAHFSPEVFPGDFSIFTGKISRERMEREHPLEYERVVKKLENVNQKRETESEIQGTVSG